MKKICMVIAGVTLSLLGYSQTIQQQVEKQINDPQRKENAGKADVIIVKKKNIFDSTTLDKSAEATNNNTVKASDKKKQCGSKTKKSSRPGAPKK